MPHEEWRRISKSELEALERKARLSSRWAEEVKRLEQEIRQLRAEAFQPINFKGAQHSRQNLEQGDAKGPQLKTLERRAYEQTIKELTKTNDFLLREVKVLQGKLAETPMQSKALSETGRSMMLSIRNLTSTRTGELATSAEGSDMLRDAYDMEGRARKDWLVSKRFGKETLAKAQGDEGMLKAGKKNASAQTDEYLMVNVELENTLKEMFLREKALKQDLLDKHYELTLEIEKNMVVQEFSINLQASIDDLEFKLSVLNAELLKRLQENHALENEVTALKDKQSAEGIMEKELVEKESRIRSLLQDIQILEDENMELTYQSLEAIWKGSISSVNPIYFADPKPARLEMILAKAKGGKEVDKAEEAKQNDDAKQSFFDAVLKEFQNVPSFLSWVQKFSFVDHGIKLINQKSVIAEICKLENMKELGEARVVTFFSSLGLSVEDDVILDVFTRLFSQSLGAPSQHPGKPDRSNVPHEEINEEIEDNFEQDEVVEEQVGEGSNLSESMDHSDGVGALWSLVSVDSSKEPFSRNRLASLDMSSMKNFLDERTLQLLKDQSRSWLVQKLQHIYKLAKAGRFPNRWAFFDIVTTSIILPFEAQLNELKLALKRQEELFAERLRRELCNIAGKLDQFKVVQQSLPRNGSVTILQEERNRLELERDKLKSELRSASDAVERISVEHKKVSGVVRLLSMSAIDRFACLGAHRRNSVADALEEARPNLILELQEERRRLEADCKAYKCCYRLLLEVWHYIPRAEQVRLMEELSYIRVQHVQVMEGTHLEMSSGMIERVLQASYGSTGDAVDVTDTIASLVRDGGIQTRLVDDALFKLSSRSKPHRPAWEEGEGGEKEEGASRSPRCLIIAYVQSDKQLLPHDDVPIRTEPQELAADALLGISEMLLRWGVTVEELMGQLRSAHAPRLPTSIKFITWERFFAFMQRIPVELGGEQEFKRILSSSQLLLDSNKVHLSVLQSRLEAHYWFLAARNRMGGGEKKLGSGSGVQEVGSFHMDLFSSRRDHLIDARAKHDDMENRVCLQALFIQSLQILLGIQKERQKAVQAAAALATG